MDFTIFPAGQAEWIKWIRMDPKMDREMDWNGSEHTDQNKKRLRVKT